MNLQTIESIAEKLLSTDPDTPVKVRLLRDVLHDVPKHELREVLEELKQHPTYAQLQKVTIRLPKPPYYSGPISRLKASLRGEDDVFRIALNIGLTEHEPHISELLQGLALYHQQLHDEQPWNDSSLRNVERFFLLNRKIVEIPGEIALISPNHPIVAKARVKAVDQIIAHYAEAEDPWSLEFEDKILPQIYAEELSEETVLTYRNMAYCTTEYPAIYRDSAFRVVGTAAEGLDDDLCHLYCDHMLRRDEFRGGFLPARDAIIAGYQPGSRLDTFVQMVAGYLLFIQDLKLYPCWRKLVMPFVEWLWEQRQDDGFWDLGVPHNGKGDLDRIKLSRNWRTYNRYQDWTANILLMFKDYYTDSTAC